MKFDDTFDQRKSDACAFALRIQFIEKSKDLILELRGNTHTIVADKKHRVAI